MILYNATDWKDEVVDSETGETIQQGTLQSAKNFNNVEYGNIQSNYALAFLAEQSSIQAQNQEVEEHDVTLKNTAKFPFNNSAVTVPLNTVRSNKNYTVECTPKNDQCLIGDIVVYDKLLNGFKVRYTGSQATLDLNLKIRGGY
jgi:hypothetical protein